MSIKHVVKRMTATFTKLDVDKVKMNNFSYCGYYVYERLSYSPKCKVTLVRFRCTWNFWLC